MSRSRCRIFSSVRVELIAEDDEICSKAKEHGPQHMLSGWGVRSIEINGFWGVDDGL